jgi:hypothetical protein
VFIADPRVALRPVARALVIRPAPPSLGPSAGCSTLGRFMAFGDLTRAFTSTDSRSQWSHFESGL